MGSARTTLRRIPRALWVFVVLQLVLVALLVMGIGRLFSVGDEESARAVSAQQRIVIDAKTGKILSPLAVKEPSDADLVPAYDVAPNTTPDPAPTDAPVDTPDAPVDTPSPTPDAPADPTPATEGTSSLDMGKPPVITAIARSHGSLVPAPAPEVSDMTDSGILPKTNKDVTPATIYAHRHVWAQEDAPPAIAILVSGLGMNARSMKAALALPPEVSFVFSPYGENSPQWVEYARNAGHEVWMELPAETTDFPRTDPGPYGIFKGLEAAEIVTHMHQAMKRFPGYVGMALPIDQSALSEAAIAVPALEELSKRGLLLAVPSSAEALSQLAHVAPHKKEVLLADAVIDSTPSEAFIRARLSKLEEQAKTKGRAFAAVSDTPLSLQVVAEWAAGLKEKNIILVPVSAMARTAKDDAPPEPPKDKKKESAH